MTAPAVMTLVTVLVALSSASGSSIYGPQPPQPPNPQPPPPQPCGPFEIYVTSCRPCAELTCGLYQKYICIRPQFCERGCTCRPGYVRGPDNRCILPYQCPVQHDPNPKPPNPYPQPQNNYPGLPISLPKLPNPNDRSPISSSNSQQSYPGFPFPYPKPPILYPQPSNRNPNDPLDSSRPSTPLQYPSIDNTVTPISRPSPYQVIRRSQLPSSVYRRRTIEYIPSYLRPPVVYNYQYPPPYYYLPPTMTQAPILGGDPLITTTKTSPKTPLSSTTTKKPPTIPPPRNITSPTTTRRIITTTTSVPISSPKPTTTTTTTPRPTIPPTVSPPIYPYPDYSNYPYYSPSQIYYPSISGRSQLEIYAPRPYQTTQVKCTGSNEQFYTCFPNCEATCHGNYSPCRSMCASGCYCRRGYVRGPQGSCISPALCPTPPLVYNNGGGRQYSRQLIGRSASPSAQRSYYPIFPPKPTCPGPCGVNGGGTGVVIGTGTGVGPGVIGGPGGPGGPGVSTSEIYIPGPYPGPAYRGRSADEGLNSEQLMEGQA